MTQLSDEILIAYTDGELGSAQVSVVDEVLASDRVTLHQFQVLAATNSRLSRAFSSMLQAEAKQAAAEQLSITAQQAPPPAREPEPEIMPQKAPRNLMVPVASAGVLLVAFGALGGYLIANSSQKEGQGTDPFETTSFWNNKQVLAEEARTKALFNEASAPQITAATGRPKSGSDIRWYEAVATRHKVDAASLLDRYNGKSRNPELALFQFTNSAIAPAMIPVLVDEELIFVGASPVQIEGRNYARLAYRDKSNGAVPVGLYVGKENGGSLTLERGYRGDDNYVRWTQERRSYMLIGAVPHWRLIVLSVAVQRQLVR